MQEHRLKLYLFSTFPFSFALIVRRSEIQRPEIQRSEMLRGSDREVSAKLRRFNARASIIFARANKEVV